jgi:hypothetical protein
MRHTRNVMLRLFTALLLVGTLVTTTGADPHKDEAHGNEGKGNKASQEKRRSKAKDWESHGHDGYFPAHGYTTLGIPPVICPRPVNVVCGVPTGLRVTNRPRNAVSTCALRAAWCLAHPPAHARTSVCQCLRV